jgi:hypothetical protein
MATDITVSNLIINKLTKAQYDEIQSPSETELYLVEESVDTTPTSGSSNLISSGGVYTALQGKATKVSGSVNGYLAGLNANGDLTSSVFKITTISQNNYDDLVDAQTVDANTIYLITES